MAVLVTAKWKSGLSQIGKHKGPAYLKNLTGKIQLTKQRIREVGMLSLTGSRRNSGPTDRGKATSFCHAL